jgi:Raf kinase inhibitor-like YbhB/YbcL family protein
LQVARAVGSPSAVAGGTAQGGFGGQPFVLQSTAFSDGGALPPEYTCDGGGQAPPLTWSGAPPATAAYALVEQDADARTTDPGMPFVEWLVYNMPIAVNQLAAGTPPRPLLSNGAQQGLNSNQMLGYLGPCPNPGDPPHHFTFALYALDGYVTLETGAAYPAVRDALTGHTLGQTQLTATFQR